MTVDLFQHAKSLHESGAIVEAEALYRQIAESDSSDAFKASNNLGTLLESIGRVPEAIEVYQKGVEQRPDCFLLHYNLGHALHQTGQLGPALFSYMKALELEPESAETHFNLGNLLFDQGRFNSAVGVYERAIECAPDFREAHSNLGSTHFELRNFTAAADCYRAALRIDDQKAAEHFNLARTLDSLGQYEESIRAYERSLEINPKSSTTHAHLVILYKKLGREYDADQLFALWKERLPEDPVADHLRASHSGENVPTRASDAYIQTIFDEFASDFDSVLAGLQYRGPQLVLEMLEQHLPLPDASLEILDACCGTGLCGPLLDPYAQTLIGMDLSLGMLEKARVRGCYDNLVHQELTQFLRENEDTFDLIVCADALIYFGELNEAIQGMYASLRAGGYAVMTFERLHEAHHDYRLNAHGRYSHALEYVGLVAQNAQFEIVALKEAVVRTEAARAVDGLVLIVRKP
ncbi:MAG: tetratricopeptide repeat protein [Planctomycetales bacterium]|nr:tetratricopeptide repeat protein [Planctomycetales bacterium]